MTDHEHRCNLPGDPEPIPLIRANNPNAFRSGEWARIIGVVVSRPRLGASPRICFQVEFLDGAKDLWPVEDAGAHEFEFKPSIRPTVNGGAQ